VYGITGYSATTPGLLQRYDVASGIITTVGDTGLGNGSKESGLAYAPDLGVLFHITKTTGDLYMIDKNTAVATWIANTGITDNSGFSGLAYGPGPSGGLAGADWTPVFSTVPSVTSNGEVVTPAERRPEADVSTDRGAEIRKAAMLAAVDVPEGPQVANTGEERPVEFTGHVLTLGESSSGSCGSILYAPSEGDSSAFRTALSAACGGATVDYYDASVATPNLPLLLTYDCVLTWANYAYADSNAFGDNLADYVDAGGKVIGRHDGYRRLHDPVTHKRMLDLDGRDLVIRDDIRARRKHDIEVFFHLAEHCTVNKVMQNCYLVEVGPGKLYIELDPRLHVESFNGSEDPICGWVSRGYHQKQAGTTLVGRCKSRGNTCLVYRIEMGRLE